MKIKYFGGKKDMKKKNEHNKTCKKIKKLMEWINEFVKKAKVILKESLISFVYIIGFISVIGIATFLLNFVVLKLSEYSISELDITKGITAILIIMGLMIVSIWFLTTNADITKFFIRCARGFTIIFILIIIKLIIFSDYKFNDIRSLDLILILASLSSSFFYLFKNIKSLKDEKRKREEKEIYGLLYAIVVGVAAIVILALNTESIANLNVEEYLYIGWFKLLLSVIWGFEILRNFVLSFFLLFQKKDHDIEYYI